MGLDMYLYAEKQFGRGGAVALRLREMFPELPPDEHGTYLSGWEFSSPEEVERTREVVELSGLAELMTSSSPSASIRFDHKDNAVVTVTCGYWRKANAVHGWFVDQVQGGVDECQHSPVHVEKLAELLSVCTKALERYENRDWSGAAELMEPRAGFFFGSTDLDDGWAMDMRDTIEIVERAVRLGIAAGVTQFAYQSSW